MLQKQLDLGLLILRISVGGLMLFHGVAKIVHGISFITDQLGALGYGVYIGEVVAPLMILIGWRTRLASIVFAINCVVAIAVAHSQDLFSIGEHGGYANELLALYLLGAVALFFTGAGKYAVSNNQSWD